MRLTSETSQPQEIRVELERILASLRFAADRQLSALLSYLVQETLAARTPAITEERIAIQGLGYSDDLATAAAPLVRIHARRLRRALNAYYETEGACDPVQIMIPRTGFEPTWQ